MELKEVQYILAIAECGSLSKAAQHLYVAQSSLSQFLKNYEAQSGYTLFIRTPQGLKPTCEGALYIHTARQIMRMQNNLNNQLMELSGLQRGKVCFSLSSFRVALPAPAGAARLPPEIPQCRGRHHRGPPWPGRSACWPRGGRTWRF